MNSYRKNEKVLFWTVVVLFIVVIVGCFTIDIHWSYNDTIYTVTVTDKENVNRGDSGYYLIFCKDADDNYYEFQNVDNFYRGKFDSSSVYNKIEVGHTYEFTVVGLRVPFLSWYQNIVEMKDVTDKTS